MQYCDNMIYICNIVIMIYIYICVCVYMQYCDNMISGMIRFTRPSG